MSLYAKTVSNLASKAVSPSFLDYIPPSQRIARTRICERLGNTTNTSPRRPFSLSITAMWSSRWRLQLQAQTLRALMAVGMNLHKIALPRPAAPSFIKKIPTTLSPQPGEINLLFYVPAEYQQRSSDSDKDAPVRRSYPVVVNFHGGGFTIGQASDDERWADTVVRKVNAVFVSVEYRLAPEYPFPTAVEDGVDAILYLVGNAEELGIDAHRLAVSGFSAGGNLAFSVPLKLQDVLLNPQPIYHKLKKLERKKSNSKGLERKKSSSKVATALSSLTSVRNPLVAIVAWYPSTDFATNTRAERRRSNARPDRELPQFLTSLFDQSYLHPHAKVPLSSPYLSPGLAPTQMLRALPDHIIMYTCEWDELLAEAERMRDRLTEEAGKDVVYRMVEGVMHGWDKNPNPLSWDPAIERVYEEACTELRVAFESGLSESNSSVPVEVQVE